MAYSSDHKVVTWRVPVLFLAVCGLLVARRALGASATSKLVSKKVTAKAAVTPGIRIIRAAAGWISRDPAPRAQFKCEALLW